MSSMKNSILYIWLPCKKIYPIGVFYLANHVHRHYPDVRQKIIDLSIVENRKRWKMLEDALHSFKPDVIAFSWRDIQVFAPHEGDDSLIHAFEFYYSLNPLKKLRSAMKGLARVAGYHNAIRENLSYIRLTKKLIPGTKILLGGGAFSVFAEQIIKELPEGITGIVGEGEGALLKILEGKELKGEGVAYREGVDISDLELDVDYISGIFPEYKSYNEDFVGVQTKRGCPHLCAFCVYNYIEGRHVRYRRPERVVKEIADLHKWGAERFWLTDAQFIPERRSIPHCTEILERMIAQKLDISWSGYIRADMITPALAGLMVKSGLCDLEVSITSGSQKIVDGLKMGLSLDGLYDGCRYLKEAGYKGKIILNYSLNSPGENMETIKDSIHSYKKIAGIFGKEQVYPIMFFLAVQPHTGLERKLMEEGYLSPDYNPLALNPFSIRRLLYNPPPLDKIIARFYLSAWEKSREGLGKEVFAILEKYV